MVSIFGDRWYGEIQWNNIPEQHELNQYVIEVCKEFDVKVVSTVDSHYPNPDAWRDRELYKRLGWLGKGKPEWLEMTLPTSAEEIGYELYPKNGDQVWNSYKEYSKLNKVTYDDDFVMGTLEETHDIAFNRIEKFYPDDTVRLPDFVVPAGYTEDEYLKRLTFKGLADAPNKVHKDQRYVTRLEHELKVIADRGFSKYFLTMKAITDKTNEIQLSGPGRGSAAGSLVAYCLGITQVDPIHYGLLFSRFLTQGERIGVWDEQNGTLTSGNFVELISDTGEKLILDPRLSVRVMRGTQTMEVEVKNLQENDTLLA
jgi:DNA polymerase-3 subunit alpha